MTLLCIVPGPTKEMSRTTRVRWCFGCRERLAHDDVVLCDEEPGYYGPNLVTRCTRCGSDRTAFPWRQEGW